MEEKKSEPRFNLNEQRRKIISDLLREVSTYQTQEQLWRWYKSLNAIKFQIIDTLNKPQKMGLRVLEQKIIQHKERKNIPIELEYNLENLNEVERHKLDFIIKFNRDNRKEQLRLIEDYETMIIELLKKNNFFKEQDDNSTELEGEI